MLQWLRRLTAANKQDDDPHELATPADPRGGLQSDEYRHAPPDDVVEEGGTVMSGPGGAPEDERVPDERREDDRPAEGDAPV